MDDLSKIKVQRHTSIKEAIRAMDAAGRGIIVVMNPEDTVLGIVTNGDFRRAVLQGVALDAAIETIANPKFSALSGSETQEEIVQRFKKKRIQQLPVIRDGRLLDLITEDDVIGKSEQRAEPSACASVPVVIMAGGKGTRMAPFTQVLPKPLMPIGEKPMVECIIDGFRKYGIKTFFLTLNYLGGIIEAYFKSIERDYEIKPVWEQKFLGTVGSLKLLEEQLPAQFLVSNCDIIVKANFADLVEFHRKHDAALTMVTSLQYHKIPYGVVNFKAGGEVSEIVEKPEYILNINTGVYVLNRDCLSLIPSDTYYDMPSLIGALMKAGRKVMAYPVKEQDYIDIGQLEEYKKLISNIENLRT